LSSDQAFNARVQQERERVAAAHRAETLQREEQDRKVAAERAAVATGLALLLARAARLREALLAATLPERVLSELVVFEDPGFMRRLRPTTRRVVAVPFARDALFVACSEMPPTFMTRCLSWVVRGRLRVEAGSRMPGQPWAFVSYAGGHSVHGAKFQRLGPWDSSQFDQNDLTALDNGVVRWCVEHDVDVRM
jgi:hypothetical protein